MNIGIFYFSATGITETIANHIVTILEKKGHSITQKNIIIPKSRQKIIDFSEFDACFFGFPVFGGRPPSVAEDWMRTLEGSNQKCSMFFTYGARDLEWAHQTTYYLLTQANFRVVLSAEFIGAHSYNVGKGWSLAKDRPNQLDFDVATNFALESIKSFKQDLLFHIDLTNFVYKPWKIKRVYGPYAHFYPYRMRDDCSMCYLCENECPVNAFNAESGKPKKKRCIRCMHCVTICPDKVLQIGDLSQLFQEIFIDKYGLTKDVVEKKRSKIVYEKA